ncbi:DNA-binding transcriptional regulator, FadR family [Gracilibacillus orientalis]|uniref:DNA-binding transcriptional regulator, FadR family n=1 Tax=Gracilibacillus orientalis TaxID=334253 RepID=A0A1I4MXK8_9BACI|nr:GntR family transcriptional regulator [Gracilibacillus orientalis]SFM08019.1 DNA-binding transcriptional regulator, FadR family [Gracilibacillus orientalis]
MSERIKVYQQVISEIQRLIKEDGYLPGDKLPSERQLSVQLDAARSSVREALRAIELLGVIETRQGEGTYFRDYQTYHAVELLASFILQGSQIQEELQQAKKLLENHVLSVDSLSDQQLGQLMKILDEPSLSKGEKHHRFFLVFFKANDNQLLLKIWRLMQDFSENMEQKAYPDQYYFDILKKHKNTIE